MKIALTLLSIPVMAFSLWVGYHEHFTLMFVAFFCFLALLLFANLDRISEFKATRNGFEAKTRERVEKAENDIRDLKTLTAKIRQEIDNTPYFIHGRLPFVGQAILRYLHQGKPININEFKTQMAHISTTEEIDNVISRLQNEHGWIERNGDTVAFTKKGEEAVKSYIELTIVRAF
jgi:hypothetical protein